MELDEAFASKDTIAHSVRDQLAHQMSEYGYEILVALVTDINPDMAVKHAMNEINGVSLTPSLILSGTRL